MLTMAFAALGSAQEYDAQQWQIKKSRGELTGKERVVNPNGGTKYFYLSDAPSNHSTERISSGSGNCNCWIDRDTSFHVVPFDGSGGNGGPGVPPNYANDDWSTNPITLPFNFCLYGTPAGTSSFPLYINNNGNVSFGNPYSVFSAVPFPSNQYVMIAPFWSDNDTRGAGSGYSYYKITAHYMVIQWDSVGYYSQHTDKVNSYQLIISDGTDPIISNGNNISFCYGKMGWTTGDASGGVNGFGGTPATVGINKGDGINFVQISLFDHAGTNYTNPAGTPPSGVNWLNYQSFQFNSCGTGNNINPIALGISPCADTINLCAVGDSAIYTTNFIPPEVTQSVTCTGNAGTIGSSHFTILNTVSGVNASITILINSTGLTSGYYTVSVTGTDNGTPPLSTTITYVVHIQNNAMPNPIVTLNPMPACLGQNPVVTLTNCNQYSTHVWSNGDTACSFPVTTTDSLYLTVTKNGCYKSKLTVIKVSPSPTITVGGAQRYCIPSTGTTLYGTVTGGTGPFTYLWNTGSFSHDTLLNAGGGMHQILVTDANGCKDSAQVTVAINGASQTISSSGNLCAGNVVLMSSVTTGTSYTWTPGASTTYSMNVNTAGTYTCIVFVNSCTVATTFTLSPAVNPTITAVGDSIICPGQPTIISASVAPAGTYTYTWYNGSSNIGTGPTHTFSNPSSTLYLVGTNTNTFCKDSIPFFINSYPPPQITISGLGTICKGAKDTLFSTVSLGHPPYTYSWSPGTGNTSAPNYVADTSNYYTLIVVDSKGCKATKNYIVKLSNPHITVPKDVYVCPGNKATIHSNGAGTSPIFYSWHPGSTIGTTFTTTVLGTYEAIMTDTYGCKDSAAVSVVANPVPEALIQYGPSPVTSGNPVTFNNISTISSGSIIWESWAFGDTGTATAAGINSETHTYLNGGSYQVTLIVQSDKGCLDTTVIEVAIQYIIVAPNIITPNGDGINEFLEFKNLLYYKNNKISIFDRWGVELYHSDNYLNNWTGKDYSDGTYYYILEIPDLNGKIFKNYFTSLK